MTKKDRLPPLKIYPLLPRTNCKLCGCSSCYAFVFALLNREKKPSDCPDLLTPAFQTSLKKLEEDFGGKEVEIIAGTGFALEKARCNGCGDCVAVCAKVNSTVIHQGIISHRGKKPPVFQIDDGIVRVVNWDSCKRVMDPPDRCIVCQEQCPFGCLELVK